MLAQSDDETCEILYLLLRAERPDVVVEISPFHGWSTCWLLSALRDNGRGRLTSFDLIDASRHNVPAELAAERWELVLGDVRNQTDRLPPKIAFLWLDSDHSAEFAEWYLREVLPRVKPDGVTAVDDVFHHRGSGQFRRRRRCRHRLAAATRCAVLDLCPRQESSALNAIHGFKVGARIAERIHHGSANPALFFRAPRA